MFVLFSYTQYPAKVSGTLKVAIALHAVFGVRLHCLNKASDSFGYSEICSPFRARQLPNGMNMSAHQVLKITPDVAQSYMKAIQTDLVLIEYDENDLFGQDTSAVINLAEESNLPILLIKNNVNASKLQHILLVVDAAYFGAGVQLNLLKKFLDHQHAKIHLLHISKKKETEDLWIEQAKYFAAVHGIHAGSIHFSLFKDMETTIIKLCIKLSIDLLCIRIQPERHGLMLHVEQLYQNLLSELKKPVLIFHLKHYD